MKLLILTTPLLLFAACGAWLARLADGRAQTQRLSTTDNRTDAKAAAGVAGAAAGAADSGAAQSEARPPLKLPLVRPRVVVSKSGRTLELYSDGRVVRRYRVGLGQRPEGDKERQGDLRTPVGDYYVCVKNPKSSFYLSLGLSYPNKEHAARGLRDKLITKLEHDRIVRAIDRRQRPPWDTALGGEIFIHGGGSSSDWTWGCLALDNPDVKELFDSIPLGTPVTINP